LDNRTAKNNNPATVLTKGVIITYNFLKLASYIYRVSFPFPPLIVMTGNSCGGCRPRAGAALASEKFIYTSITLERNSG